MIVTESTSETNYTWVVTDTSQLHVKWPGRFINEATNTTSLQKDESRAVLTTLQVPVQSSALALCRHSHSHYNKTLHIDKIKSSKYDRIHPWYCNIPETVDLSSLLFFTKELRLSSSAVLMHGQAGQLPGGLANTGPHANLCILYTACFLIFKH
jgi:hypothetical protein